VSALRRLSIATAPLLSAASLLPLVLGATVAARVEVRASALEAAARNPTFLLPDPAPGRMP
jgi:hypothetical protein